MSNVSSSTMGALSLLLCAGVLNSQDSKSVGQSTPVQITKELRKAALRSVEASRSLAASSLDVMAASDPGGSVAERQEKELEYSAIKRDASKQLTEAKIEAESPDEKKVYQLLKAQYELTPTGTESLKDQRRYMAGVARCRMEVLTIIEPDHEDLPQMRKNVVETGCLAIKAALDKEATAAVDVHRK